MKTRNTHISANPRTTQLCLCTCTKWVGKKKKKKHPLLYTPFNPTAHARQTPGPPSAAARGSHICQLAAGRNIPCQAVPYCICEGRFSPWWDTKLSSQCNSGPSLQWIWLLWSGFPFSSKQAHLLSVSRDGSAGWVAGPCRATRLPSTSLGGQQHPAEGTGHGKTLRTSEWVPWAGRLRRQLVSLKCTISSMDSPTRYQPAWTRVQHGQGRKERVLLHKWPTPGDDWLSRWCLLDQGKVGNSEGRRNFRTARITAGMLTASTTIATLFVRPGWWNTLSASKHNLPRLSQLRCFPRTCPSVCAEDHCWHQTRAAEQIWTMRSSENDSVFLRPLPPQRAVQGAEAAVLLLLLFSKLHKNLEQAERMRVRNAPYRSFLSHK